MAQINLLKQQKQTTGDAVQKAATAATRILALLLVAVLVYYGYLYYQAKTKTTQVNELTAQIAKDQKELDSIPGKNELYTRQQQLSQLMSIVSNHSYWSSLMPALAKVTLKTAYYSSLKAQSDGTIAVTVTVPTTEDLDKFLQVFDLPEYYNNFYNIKVSSIGKNQVGNSLMTQFNVSMQYNPSLLKYQAKP